MNTDVKELLDTMRAAIVQALVDTHTIAVAKVTAVGATTISCRPVINRLVDGVSVALPEFVEVPPVFLQGGGSYTAHPIAAGDYCLLLFSERCFDRWYHGEDGQLPLELRMHDYSDGFALVGVNPLATAITIPTVIQQTGDTNQDGDYTHQGKRTQTGDHVQTGNRTLTGNVTHTGDYTQTGDFTLTGNLQVNGNITCTGLIAAGGFAGLSGGAMTSNVDFITTGEVTASGKNLSTHTHYVPTSPGESNAPT